MPKHTVMSSRHGRLVKQSFLRSRHKTHGGLIRDKASDTYMPRDVVMSEYENLDEAVYVADSDYGQVWGHFLLEVLPRLWGLNEVRRATKVATSVPLQPMHFTLLKALGIGPSRLIHLTRPIRPRRAYLPEPPVRIRSYAHPVALEIFDRVARLRFQSTVTPLERVYVSRRKVATRRLSNEAEVESFFESIGFTVIHPQDLSIEDQIAVLRARV